MHHTVEEQNKQKKQTLPGVNAQGEPLALPLREDAPDLPASCDPQPKNLMRDTSGGKITDAVIYKGLGFVGNSSLSVGITYWVNPTKQAKWARKTALEGATRVFKDFLPQPAINNAVDIGFMLIAGTILTAFMAPLVNRREKIARWINQKLGKDQDVMPENQRTFNTPLTLDDKIEQELKKRVNYQQTSGDLWSARWSGIWLPVFGDMALGKWSAGREKQGKWSVDTVSWKTGQHLYNDVLPQKTVKRMGDFFKRHGAGMEDVKANNREIYDRLSKVEDLHERINTEIHGKPAIDNKRDDRMMIADQTRLLGKEVGWTVILAEFVEKLTKRFQARRIHKQERKAIAQMREEGIIPAGVHVTTDKEGHVKLTKTNAYVPPAVVPGIELVPNSPDAIGNPAQFSQDKVAQVANATIEKANQSARQQEERDDGAEGYINNAQATHRWADGKLKAYREMAGDRPENFMDSVGRSREQPTQHSVV